MTTVDSRQYIPCRSLELDDRCCWDRAGIPPVHLSKARFLRGFQNVPEQCILENMSVTQSVPSIVTRISIQHDFIVGVQTPVAKPEILSRWFPTPFWWLPSVRGQHDVTREVHLESGS
ncbi:hypothetical protein MIND_01349800 [Mycena indigotica]|uniref:Uncharacterized protein n=1 Tax=Mycena indigotica TaxID=2126181 RepID=A0A8H6RZB4_9AGAR|nr:uncharacterized protein MIND_01349800 [Mycena indigotica]KAF7289761.1 hypothetical protein MIND_01349800 [Mycena indigotica]